MSLSSHCNATGPRRPSQKLYHRCGCLLVSCSCPRRFHPSMGFNNAALVHSIGNTVDSSHTNSTSCCQQTRRRVSSDPCLPERLPSSSNYRLISYRVVCHIPQIGFMQREAERLAPRELTKQLLQATMEETVDTDSVSNPGVRNVRPDVEPIRSPSYIHSFVMSMVGFRPGRTLAGWSNVQVCGTKTVT